MTALISTAELADLMAQRPARLRIFDATAHLRRTDPGPYAIESGRADYLAAHLPGAAFVDLQQELSDRASPLRFTLPPVAHLEAALSAAGLSNGDDCVVYSSTAPMWATRLWWMLRALGVASRVLDGGLPQWKAEGRALTRGEHRHPAGRLRAAPRPRLWADRQEVLRSIGAADVCTLNALSAPVHAGTGDLHYGRRGHIAGSVNVPFAGLQRPDGRFKPLPELHAAFTGSGALAARRVICYCGGGIAATMTALALDLLGHGDVAVYDGSLSEWVLDPALPMDTGSHPGAGARPVAPG